MSQPPITVTYSLEEILTRLEGKIDNLEKRFDKVDERFNKVDEHLNQLEIGQARLEEKIDGLSKRVESQEFINRGVVIALVVAILGGLAKLFGFIPQP